MNINIFNYVLVTVTSFLKWKRYSIFFFILEEKLATDMNSKEVYKVQSVEREKNVPRHT